MSILPIQPCPDPTPTFPPFDLDRALVTARIHAARVCGRSYAKQHDREDLVQELVVEAYRHWRKFDPTRGAASTFLSITMANHAISLCRRHKAAKRGSGRSSSIRRQHRDSLITSGEDPAMRLDLEAAMDKLPRHLVSVCLLLETYSLSETARRLCVSRRRLSDWIRAIRTSFVASGLETHNHDN